MLLFIKNPWDLFVNRIKIAQFHLYIYLLNYTFHSLTMHTRSTCTQRYSFFPPKKTLYNPNTQKTRISGADTERRIASLKNKTCFLCSQRFSSFSFFSLFHHIVAFWIEDLVVKKSQIHFPKFWIITLNKLKKKIYIV